MSMFENDSFIRLCAISEEKYHNLMRNAQLVFELLKSNDKWRPPSLNEITPVILNMGLNYLGSEASKSFYDFD